MKVSFLSESIQKRLSLLNHAVSAKSQLPVLLNFLIETSDGKLKISATDLEIGIEIYIPTTIEEEGGITVPAKVFTELINSLPVGKITLQTEGGSLKVISSRSESIFQTISQEDFPKLYQQKGDKIAEISVKDLHDEFLKVVFAASLDIARPALTGVLMKKEETGFLLVATDGYRLSLKHYKAESVSNLENGASFLIPSRLIKEVIGLKGEDGPVILYTAKESNQVVFEQKDVLIVGRLIEAEFPSYERILPEDFATRVIFDRGEFQSAVKTSAIFARETANIIKVSAQKDKLVLSANTPSVGSNSVEIEVKQSGEENEIAFNARYVLDMLSIITENEMVFEMTGPLNPGVFKIASDPSYLHIIMPIRIQTEK